MAFLAVPLVAALFGKRKLEVSAWNNLIEDDMELLETLGASQQADIRHGVAPRVERMLAPSQLG